MTTTSAPNVKELVLDDEGQVTFRLEGTNFEVEIFQQQFLKAELTTSDARKLLKFLVLELL